MTQQEYIDLGQAQPLRLLAEAAPSGIYILTPRGELGYFDGNRKFVIDEELTQNFADHNRQFIRGYLENPNDIGTRVALTYQTDEPRAWRSETMRFTTSALRRLYPEGPFAQGLLSGKQRTRMEMSIYRGLETLLNYRVDISPRSPIFCPVLINRHTSLDSYLSELEGADGAQPTRLPVFEVVNLVASVPIRQRNTPEIRALHDRIYYQAIGSHRGLAGQQLNGVPAAALRPTHALTETGEVAGVTPEMLRNFDRFAALRSTALEKIARHAILQQASAGYWMARRGSSDLWNYYLLGGAVLLESATGERREIVGGSTAARAPVINQRPRPWSARALTAITYLQINAYDEADILNSALSTLRDPVIRPS